MIENVLGGGYRSRKSKTYSPSMQPTEEPNDDDCEEYIYIYKIECDDYDDDKFNNYIGKYEYIGNDDEYGYPIYQKCDSDNEDKESKDSTDSKDDDDSKDSKQYDKDSGDDSKDEDKDSKDSKDSKDDDDKDSKSDDDDSKDSKDSTDSEDDNDNNNKAEITLGRRFEKLELKINFPNIGSFYEPNCVVSEMQYKNSNGRDNNKNGYAKVAIDDEYDPFNGKKENKWENKNGDKYVDIVAVIQDSCNEKAFDMY